MPEGISYLTTAEVARDAGAMLLERREQAARRVVSSDPLPGETPSATSRRVQVGQLKAEALPAAPFGAVRPQDEPMLRFFGFTHLPAHLQDISKPFHDLAQTIVAIVPRNAEQTVALRDLLTSKDAAVRAVVFP